MCTHTHVLICYDLGFGVDILRLRLKVLVYLHSISCTDFHFFTFCCFLEDNEMGFVCGYTIIVFSTV